MTTYVTASCHCSSNVFKIPFKTSLLPKSGGICHCNICRHSTGQMCYMDVRVDGEPLSVDSTGENPIPANLDNLTAFHSSSYATRYFCSTCSAHMFFRNTDDSHWAVLPGVLERVDGIVTMRHHMFIGDTLDGGLSEHYRRVGERVITRYKQDEESDGSGKIPFGWKDEKVKTRNANAGSFARLPYYCQCRSIRFYLTRATKPSEDPQVYWLVPGEKETDPVRYTTAHCLCNSCRLTGGSLIQSWTVVPSENVFNAATNAPIDLVTLNKRPKALKQYDATPGKHREFCGTCGATVFWWRELREGEPPHMDVAVGLVDQNAAGGARAEGWLAWYSDDIMHRDAAISEETRRTLEDGLGIQSF